MPPYSTFSPPLSPQMEERGGGTNYQSGVPLHFRTSIAVQKIKAKRESMLTKKRNRDIQNQKGDYFCSNEVKSRDHLQFKERL